MNTGCSFSHNITDKTYCMVTQKEITHLDKDEQHKKYTDTK